MDGIFWLEEYSGKPHTSVSLKRKAKSKKLEFIGWGSKPLIEFLDSIGKDTTEKISQHDVSDIIGKYINENNLINPAKKKRVICDEKLYYLFGRKTINRIKVYDLLETHYAENLDAWDDDFLFSSGEENLGEEQKGLSLEKKTYQKKRIFETPKNGFAAIVPENIKLVYLKKSLVLDLLKDFESFEAKVVDSFVRIKSDPKSFLQKNSHQLVLVKGMKRVSVNNDVNTDVVLQVSNFVKDVKISMLSDDDFSQEECEDLHQRIKKGLLKRPTIAELEAKAQILHADITKDWLTEELTLLPKLIDRANEKAHTMFEYMERRQLLQTPDEQARLLREVPNVIAEEVEPETAPQDVKHEDCSSQKLTEPETAPQAVKHENNSSQKSAARETLEVPTDSASIEKLSILTPLKTDSATQSSSVITKDDTVHLHDVQEQLIRPSHSDVKSVQVVNVPEESSAIVEQNFLKILDTTRVIDLSDDDDDEEHVDSNKVEPEDDVGSLMWHYEDPQGDIQGPFSLISLKTWMDADYFPNDFKVWKTGQSRNNAVLLVDIVRQMFRI
ncbi:SWIB/MDM2 domain,Plus-3,GYF, putative isoform 2 [Hibiscus syriacus]|uniref:SWIB/MDM2 domain,Plus-3,GYF, putative isoform 2 n=1 Tax=Hibiscus syriacus TaxID=106335 RepID=A0A6A3BNY8_HIBSY|nr:SWIB/MDM2 domain,Plus-3,GYF, putative isoform 2 [Hibiscus syriacus]